MTQNKTALITGASSGIGYEFAKLLAKDNYNLILVARSEEKLNYLKNYSEAEYKISVKVIVKDLSKIASVDEIYNELVRKKIYIDILINNAGFGNFGKFSETNWQTEAEMIQLNILALTHLTKLFLKGMIERKRGKILNVASTGSFQPCPLMAVYGATKAYVLSFSEAIANELKGTGITVTALCPGPTETNFFKVGKFEESKIVKNKKLPSAEDVAKYGYNAMNKSKTVAIHGLMNKTLAFLVGFAPRNLVTNVSRKKIN
ncbi:MAG: SDR family oxidoreductase [Bacteroidales bacterium]|nr:SDR family oxidoreductase [Bacteroidales bacterium]